ncbi:MAG: hypothetical protein IJW67_13795, partial [Blautia sp.]|nr:hypothetical protein [Blautia sp.]
IDGLNYFNPEAGVYNQVMRATEKGASRDNFDFATGDSLVEQVTQALADVSYPVNEFQFSWFSLSGEEHKQLEQDALENGMIEKENMQGDWNGKDEYEIYAWQMYDNLPVFPQLMTTAISRAFESYQKAPVTAMVTRHGMQSLVAQLPYSFMETDEIVSFLPFSKIAAAVEDHYEKILTEQTYIVNRAKLALRVYLDEKQDLQAEPIWYFEVSDNSGRVEVVLIQAETGKEIYLN